MAGNLLGTRLRARRVELGLSLEELSGPGVSPTLIGRVERGERNPSMQTLRFLAPRLDVSVSWLETGAESSASRLARLVLEGDGGSDVARKLARHVLGGS